jgi:hypothetical protein
MARRQKSMAFSLVMASATKQSLSWRNKEMAFCALDKGQSMGYNFAGSCSSVGQVANLSY